MKFSVTREQLSAIAEMGEIFESINLKGVDFEMRDECLVVILTLKRIDLDKSYFGLLDNLGDFKKIYLISPDGELHLRTREGVQE